MYETGYGIRPLRSARRGVRLIAVTRAIAVLLAVAGLGAALAIVAQGGT